MVGTKRRWLDLEMAAAELGLPPSVVKEAVENGELPALVIGGNIRINLDAALDKAAGRPLSDGAAKLSMPVLLEKQARDAGVPVPVGLKWMKELVNGEDYSHGWPQKQEDYGTDSSEQYTEVQDGEISLLAQEFAVKVGRATRYDRGRLTVFFNKIAIAEFMQTADEEHWASLIKPDGKKVLPSGQLPPPLYQGARVESYREVTDYERWRRGSGIGIPKGMAVVIPIDDYRSAVHHAAARWLGKRGHIVEGVGE